jgi:hypothetical protein
MIVWKCISTILAKGNPINVSHNHEARSNYCTFYWQLKCPLNTLKKTIILGIVKSFAQFIRYQWARFGLLSHRLVFNKQNTHRWKQEKESQIVCGQSLKTTFKIFKTSPWEHYISKKKIIISFLNKFLYFQSCNYKIFMKIHHVSRVLLYV